MSIEMEAWSNAGDETVRLNLTTKDEKSKDVDLLNAVVQLIDSDDTHFIHEYLMDYHREKHLEWIKEHN